MSIEIERRFLIDEMPYMPIDICVGTERKDIEQFYIHNDIENHKVSRCRRTMVMDGEYMVTSCVMTHKCPNPNGDGSIEIEDEISGETYDLCRQYMLVGNILTKTRYVVPTGMSYEVNIAAPSGVILGAPPKRKSIYWEIDVFDNGKMIAEIELPKLDYPLEVSKFLSNYTEITGDHRYSNSTLALNGWPE